VKVGGLFSIAVYFLIIWKTVNKGSDSSRRAMMGTPPPHLEMDLTVEADELDPVLDELVGDLERMGAGPASITEFARPAPGIRGGGDAGTIATLLLSVVGSAEVLRAVVDTVRWALTRRDARSAELTIGDATLKVTGLSTREQGPLIDAWVERVLAPDPTRAATRHLDP
jgi:hypothetical protein